MRFVVIILLLSATACNSKKRDEKTSSTVVSGVISKKDSINHLDDSLIIGERIDGPANIRDTINGKLLFSLKDNVVVTTTEEKNNWLQVGLVVDLTQKQLDSLCILKGSKLLIDGKEVGYSVENIPLIGGFKTNEGLRGELAGYTSVSNIKQSTIPENVFLNIVNSTSYPLTTSDFKKFISDFKFMKSDGFLKGFNGFQIDENWIDDPSPLLRLFLLFKNNKFYGVFHSRPLTFKDGKTIKVNRGFYFTTLYSNDETTDELVKAFNYFIGQVD